MRKDTVAMTRNELRRLEEDLRHAKNMADFGFADRYFKLLPIPVPILLIGLLPEN